MPFARIAAIIAAALVLWGGSARAAGPLRGFQAGLWSGGAYTDELIFSGPNAQQKMVKVDLTVFDTPDGVHSPFDTVIWSGASLNPGDELWIKEKRVLKGAGSVNKRLPRTDMTVDRAKLPPSVRVVEEPSQENNFTLRLACGAGAPVYDLTISWTAKK